MKEKIKDVSPIADSEQQSVEKPQQKYAELPGLLFSKIGKNEMFDVDKFLESAGSEKKLADYLSYRDEYLTKIAAGLSINKKYLSLKVEGEPNMLDGYLAIDFACWVIPELQIYLHERSSEMLINGFTVSDRYLGAAAQRLPKQEDQKG